MIMSDSLIKRLLKEHISLSREIYCEFSGDFNGSELAIWREPIVIETLAEIGVTANELRDEINLDMVRETWSCIDFENKYPERYFINLE